MNAALKINHSSELSVGAFEAKTHFSELLRKVEEGYSVKITRNGKEIAIMQNSAIVKNQQAVQAWNKILSVCDNSNSNKTISVSEILEWRDYGRK